MKFSFVKSFICENRGEISQWNFCMETWLSKSKITHHVQREYSIKMQFYVSIIKIMVYHSCSLTGRSVLYDATFVWAYLCHFCAEISCFYSDDTSQLSKGANHFFGNFFTWNCFSLSIIRVPLPGDEICKYSHHKMVLHSWVCDFLWLFLVFDQMVP